MCWVQSSTCPSIRPVAHNENWNHHWLWHLIGYISHFSVYLLLLFCYCIRFVCLYVLYSLTECHSAVMHFIILRQHSIASIIYHSYSAGFGSVSISISFTFRFHFHLRYFTCIAVYTVHITQAIINAFNYCSSSYRIKQLKVCEYDEFHKHVTQEINTNTQYRHQRPTSIESQPSVGAEKFRFYWIRPRKLREKTLR